MGRSYLGEFEELVLLTVAILGQHAYGVSVCEELFSQTGRSVNISAAHAALHRLERKRDAVSRLGDATAERGGKRKRLFFVTALGSKILHDIRETRSKLWNAISDGTLPAFSL